MERPFVPTCWEFERLRQDHRLRHLLQQVDQMTSAAQAAGQRRLWFIGLCERAWVEMQLAQLWEVGDPQLSAVWHRRMERDIDTVRKFAAEGV